MVDRSPGSPSNRGRSLPAIEVPALPTAAADDVDPEGGPVIDQCIWGVYSCVFSTSLGMNLLIWLWLNKMCKLQTHIYLQYTLYIGTCWMYPSRFWLKAIGPGEWVEWHCFFQDRDWDTKGQRTTKVSTIAILCVVPNVVVKRILRWCFWVSHVFSRTLKKIEKTMKIYENIVSLFQWTFTFLSVCSLLYIYIYVCVCVYIYIVGTCWNHHPDLTLDLVFPEASCRDGPGEGQMVAFLSEARDAWSMM